MADYAASEKVLTEAQDIELIRQVESLRAAKSSVTFQVIGASMAKRSKRLPPLTHRGRDLVSHVLNAAAFGTHGDDAELEAMAKEFKTTPTRLRTYLRKLEKQGWLTVEGTAAEIVYPTAAAIRILNPNISQAEAAKTVRKLHRR